VESNPKFPRGIVINFQPRAKEGRRGEELRFILLRSS
jgi:hypothetical protein